MRNHRSLFWVLPTALLAVACAAGEGPGGADGVQGAEGAQGPAGPEGPVGPEGTIPASIQSAVTSVGARFPGKLCQIVSV